ncbi:hypothetical protein [Lichenicola sp.]|uniref:hypothetical protein n=1 Tax=Lichenicola sp. TaxID=2804529 RepID=UPI003AFFB6DA
MEFAAAALSGWTLDERFIDTLVARSAGVDIVSFDIFDTAVTRSLDSPADAFAEMERRLAASLGAGLGASLGAGLGNDAEGYAELREQAECRARLHHQARSGAEEVDLEQILDALLELRPGLAPDRDALRRLELAVEQDLLLAVPDILEATRRLVALGRPYILVSDMYLPGAFLAGQLRRLGYAGWQALHVSSETGATKATGRQWPIIRAALGSGSTPGAEVRILHVGDDAHSDGSEAQANGIETLLYTRARSERRLASRLTPDVLPFARSQRAAMLHARRTPDAASEAGGKPAAWHDLGRVFGGIVVGGFIRWLAERVQAHGVTALQFAARDGWLIREAWRRSGLGEQLGVEDHYLCISRRTVNLARGFLDTASQLDDQPGRAPRLPDWLLEFLSTTSGTVSVGTALKRLPLDPGSDVGRALAAAFGSLDATLTWPDGCRLFQTILQRHAGSVLEVLRQSHAGLTGYLVQEGFDRPGRIGFVDMGWHGTMQRSLQRLALRPADSLCGFYYGLWQAAIGNRHGAGLMESAFASEFIPPGEQPGMLDAVGILEELHSAPQGTVSGYRQHDGRWEPVFADHPDEQRQHAEATRHFQDGTLETIEAMFQPASTRAAPGTLPLRPEMLTPDAVRAAIDAVCLSPSAGERALLGAIGHCGTFDHIDFDPLVPPDCPADTDDLVALHRRCEWRTGTMLAWCDAAGGARRAELHSLARSLLAHHGGRNLRQYV